MTEDAARAIRNATYTAYMLTLASADWPQKAAVYARMSAPVVGDMVVEVTTIWIRARSAIDAVGELLRISEEPVRFDPPWDEAAEGEPCPSERVVYIRTLDEREFRWTNATFIAVPEPRTLEV